MNDEIKEKIDFIKQILNRNELIKCSQYFNDLLDYITNLQQALWEENEKLKQDYINVRNYIKMRNVDTEVEDKALLYNIELENINKKKYLDYKSRCEKASECIKKDTRWFDSEYTRVYGELCDCAGAKGDRLEVMVNPSNALNILQNGSDGNE